MDTAHQLKNAITLKLLSSGEIVAEEEISQLLKETAKLKQQSPHESKD